jgi:2-polyprenyl-3-methyl-5-hydroxy-6-metoxy-1,4-benzoquinol methylase
VKPAGYYGQDRAELVRLLPRPLGSVLDVGCGEGATGRSLRATGATWISGIELDPDAAAVAAAHYDEVRVGRAEDELAGLTRPFDTILLYDVLEHLPEPWSVLRRLHEVAVADARVHVSVPNARHWTLLRDVAVRGSFGYGDAGHRDRTHLRWFTKRDLVELLEETGWSVESVAHGETRPVSRLAERLTRGLSAEFLVYQLSALARANRSAPAAPRAGAG